MYKQYVGVLFNAIKDKKLPTKVKILLGLGIAYIISPVDFLPDVGLPVGLIDDTILAAIMLGVGGKMIYNQIKAEKNGTDPDEENVIDV